MSSTNMHSVPKDRVVIVACPVDSTAVRHVAGGGVLMTIEFVESYDQYETGERSSLQFLLAPKQAGEVGEALMKAVQAMELGAALKRTLKDPAKLLPVPSPNGPVVA